MISAAVDVAAALKIAASAAAGSTAGQAERLTPLSRRHKTHGGGFKNSETRTGALGNTDGKFRQKGQNKVRFFSGFRGGKHGDVSSFHIFLFFELVSC